MVHWLITLVLVAIAYFMGRRHGWEAMDNYYCGVLDKIARRIGVRSDDSYFANPDEPWMRIIHRVRANRNDNTRN